MCGHQSHTLCLPFPVAHFCFAQQIVYLVVLYIYIFRSISEHCQGMWDTGGRQWKRWRHHKCDVLTCLHGLLLLLGPVPVNWVWTLRVLTQFVPSVCLVPPLCSLINIDSPRVPVIFVYLNNMIVYNLHYLPSLAYLITHLANICPTSAFLFGLSLLNLWVEWASERERDQIKYLFVFQRCVSFINKLSPSLWSLLSPGLISSGI